MMTCFQPVLDAKEFAYKLDKILLEKKQADKNKISNHYKQKPYSDFILTPVFTFIYVSFCNF